jgi:hypothetical protein
MSRVVSLLRRRGLLASVTSEALDDVVTLASAVASRPGVYAGFDPTAASLHLGNLVVLVTMRHFQSAGFRPILLVLSVVIDTALPSCRCCRRVRTHRVCSSCCSHGWRRAGCVTCVPLLCARSAVPLQ